MVAEEQLAGEEWSGSLSDLNASLRSQSAESVFAEDGTLTEDALANSREIIQPTDIGNPNVPDGLGKWATQTYQSPSGDFQVHFYRNGITGEPYYGLDYKAVFTNGVRFYK